MTSIVVEEELGAMSAIEQILRERGFSVFTIPYVEAGYSTEGDYFAEITQYTHDSVICTPRFGVPAGDEDFFKALLDLYRYNAPFMYSRWWAEQVECGGLWPLKGGKYALSKEIQSLGGKLYPTFASALYASHTRKDVIIDEYKGECVRR